MKSYAITPKQSALRVLSPLLAIIAGFCVVLSLKSILAEWAALIWLISCILVFIAFYRGRNEVFSYNFKMITALLLVSVAIAAHWTQGWQYVLAQAIVLMLGIKLMELKSQRDSFQFCGLGVLGLSLASLIRFDLGFGVLIFLFLFLGLVLIMWQHLFDRTGNISGAMTSDWKFSLRLILFAFLLTNLTIIAGLLLFFVMPRNINPVWNLGPDMEVHRTGFSPEMTPGNISEIVASNKVAFRARIKDQVNPSQLYWRGTVLWETDGRVWRPNSPHEFQALTFNASGDDPDLIEQTITLNPGRTNYLFGLYFPEQVADVYPVFYNPDRTVRLNKETATALRYKIFSRRSDKNGLSPQEARAGLDIPAGLEQRVIDLAGKFGREDYDPWRVARAILNYFSADGFEYSMTSPPGFEEGQTLAEFLLETRKGYCELYAAATTIMLRLNNIPARVVVGFWGGEFNPLGEYWIVRDSMAHAWVEAWFEDRGWVLLDPTRQSGINSMDETGNVISGLETESLYPVRMVSPALRVTDWLSWQWVNAVIDLTLNRQTHILGTIRSGIQDSWSVLSAPDVYSRDRPVRNKIFFAVISSLILVPGYFIVRRLSRGENLRTNPEEKLRTKAWKRLARKTPGRHDLKKPGREEQIWEWWEKNHPARICELKRIYYSQRYGPSPDSVKDARLKYLLSGTYFNCNR